MTTKTTTETITDRQIRALRTESAGAGDLLMCAICDVALGREVNPTVLDANEHLTLATSYTTSNAARAECARVIADAEAQS